MTDQETEPTHKGTKFMWCMTGSWNIPMGSTTATRSGTFYARDDSGFTSRMELMNYVVKMWREHCDVPAAVSHVTLFYMCEPDAVPIKTD